MSAKYLIRFDDVCPTMNWSVWSEVEHILADSCVKPVLAVVPDNRHPQLEAAAPNPQFWSAVRSWQQRGWTIGLHGYQHLASTEDGGILNVNPWSEFSGLSFEEQASKVRRALEIFEGYGVRPELWIAPAHSFDAITLRILRNAGIHCLSDGFSLYPYRDTCGTIWVPQQLWRVRKMPFGVWTVCLHVNRWDTADINRFRSELQQIASGLTNWKSVISLYRDRRRSLSDRVFSKTYPAAMGAWSWVRKKIHSDEIHSTYANL